MLVGSNDYEPGLFRTELALLNVYYSDADWDAYNLAGFTCPAGIHADASIAAKINTWRYRYFGIFPNINVSSEGGVYHVAELPLIFGSTFSHPNATAEEIKFEAYMRGAWTAFAKDPVKGLRTYEGGWPSYDPAKESLVCLAYHNLVSTNVAFPMLYDVGCVNASLSALQASIFR